MSSQATSRLIVKNLAPSVDEKQLRAHFSKHGELTDVKIIKNQGKSRCFAFVGFRQVATAQEAKTTLNKSFIGSTRINVEFAQARGQNQSTKSKEAPKPLLKVERESNQVKRSPKKLEGNPKDSLKEEFVSAMKRTSNTWSKEDEASQNSAKRLRIDPSGDSDAESEDSAQDIVIPAPAVNPAVNKSLSDLNYLKAKSSLAGVSEEEMAQTNKPKIKKAKQVMVVGEGGASMESAQEEINEVHSEEDRRGEEKEGKDDVSNRLFVRNLPYSVEEEELKSFFSQHGKVSEVFIPVDELKRQKGFAFVSYFFPEEAQAAQEKLKEVIFQGRPLHISSAVDKNQHKSGGGGIENMSKDELSALKTNGAYKQWKELERRKKAMETEGWNASHVRSDAVVDVISNRLNVNKSDFLDVNESNMAVRLAIGETHIISENIDFFAKEGIDLNTLISKNSNGNTQKRRSDRVLLVKNIPASSDAIELSNLFSKHGELERFLLPPSKLVALVEFIDPKEAKKAFKALAYKRYQNVPLYLEWAPQEAIGERKTTQKLADSDDSEEEEEQTKIVTSKKLKASFLEDEEEEPNALVNDENSTVYVKNLSFQTNEETLKNFFSKVNGVVVRNVFIPRNKTKAETLSKTKNHLSLGYGFVEFANLASVEIVLNKLQGAVLDGKSLELKRSQKKMNSPTPNPSHIIDEDKDGQEMGETRTKLLVKNVAFQTSMQELRELFSTFGTLKSLSMPKKYDGRHRGFAFVDYVLAHEASEAKKQLASSHFYGRHLIIEYAKDDSITGANNVEDIRKKAKKTVNASKIVEGINKRSKQGKSDGFDEFMGGGQEEDD